MFFAENPVLAWLRVPLQTPHSIVALKASTRHVFALVLPSSFSDRECMDSVT